MTDAHPNGNRAYLQCIFQSGKYSDLTICSGDRTFMVHRAIVCPQSQFFAAACDNKFQESITGRIVLDEDDPSTVERMLSYIYTLDYDDESPSSPLEAPPATDVLKEDHTESALTSQSVSEDGENGTTDSAAESQERNDRSATTGVCDGDSRVNQPWLLNNVLVYSIADKYGIRELKELAKAKFSGQAQGLLSAKDFPSVIKMVYESTPSSDRGLRDVVCLICTKQVRSIIDSPLFIATVGENGCFCFEILCEVLKQDDERLEETLALRDILTGEAEESKAKRRTIQRQLDRIQGSLKLITTEVSKVGSTNEFLF